jgi:uncharacterized protein YndB with AHSA1/START domain
MPTTSPLGRAETRSISISAPPEAVLRVLADPDNLPRWAPAFARAVRIEDGQLLVDTGQGELAIHLAVSRPQGTVDLVSAAAPGRGAFSRVIPNGEGSEYLFTLFFAPGTDEATVQAQMVIVAEELAAVRALCEPAFARPAAA